MTRLAVLLTAAAAFSAVTALPSSIRRSIIGKHGAPSGLPALVGEEDAASSPAPTPVPDSFFTQRLDHFEHNTQTWNQRYFVRPDFFDGTGPVFLCVGGEGPPLTGNVLIASVHCNDAVELAEKLGAMLFAVEHRYYGKSIPTPDFTTENLRWLSAHQALADLAYFHEYATAKYNLTSANKWVSFGGSYPGMLSGWFRYKFPHLATASVSSSSPVQARVEFKGYNEVVANSMTLPIVGGSTACLDIITSGHKMIGSMLETAAGRATLSSQFNLCNDTALEATLNQASWAGEGVVYLPAQENDPSCTSEACNISGICSFLSTAAGDNVAKLAALSKLQNGGQCVDVDYREQNAAILNTTVEGGTARIWFYQTCTEFGFYQTCDTGTTCPYTQGISNLQQSLDMCKLAFDIDADTVTDRVNFSLAYWGGRELQGSKILFPNGEVDPWHYLGVLESPDPQEPTLWVKGASHHFWTHPSLPTDTPEIVAAREQIWSTVTEWLK